VSVNAPSSTRGQAAPSASALREHVGRAVRRYLSDLGEYSDGELHAFVLREVEAPLFAEVMRHFGGNQTRAAAALGINRATLRRRLRDLGLD
jgi:Fis family transcriptional regulator, factor for inversion stimulation protein